MQPVNEQLTKVGSEEEPTKKVKRGSSVGLRWLTALLLIPVVLSLAWFGGWVAFAGLCLAAVLSMSEMNMMLRHAGHRPLIWLSLLLSLSFLLAAVFPAYSLLILQISMGSALIISFVALFLRRNLDGALTDWALTLASAVYVGWPMSLFLSLRGPVSSVLFPSHGGLVFLPPGAWWLLTLLLSVWGCDSAAFFAGRYFGRHKMAPHLSPAKTWEGMIGGMVFAIIGCLLFTALPLGVPWYLAVLLGILVGFASVLGDLAESLIKRQTNVKDSGQIMPGHGGILDRIDSLLFVVIVIYIFAQLVMK